MQNFLLILPMESGIIKVVQNDAPVCRNGRRGGLKIPCANNTCGFDPHHRHKNRGCCTCDSPYFCMNKHKNQAISIPKTKACVTNFRRICDAHAFLNYLIIRLILRMAVALSTKTMCSSPFSLISGCSVSAPAALPAAPASGYDRSPGSPDRWRSGFFR